MVVKTFLVAFILSASLWAQDNTFQGFVSSTCAPTGTPYTDNNPAPVTIDANGRVCFSAVLNLTVAGSLTNNNAAPSSNNIGALDCIANAAAPSWTEGFQVLCSVDLSGRQRVLATQMGTWNIGTLTSITNALPAGSNVIGHVITDSGSVTTATLNAETTKVIGTVRVLGNTGATIDGAPGSAVPTNAVQLEWTDGTNGRVPLADPCTYSTLTYYYVNVAANTQIAGLAGSSKNYYLCEFDIYPVAAAANVNLVSSGTAGNACASSTTAWLTGGTTAATGASIAVNGGFIVHFTGRAHAITQATNHAICIFASATVTGVVIYAGPL